MTFPRGDTILIILKIDSAAVEETDEDSFDEGTGKDFAHPWVTPLSVLSNVKRCHRRVVVNVNSKRMVLILLLIYSTEVPIRSSDFWGSTLHLSAAGRLA